MKTWKGYNILDLILITLGIGLAVVAEILFHSKWYVIACTIFGLLCVFTQAKGKILTQFLGILDACFYIINSYTQKYYGEALLYLIVMLPMYFYGIFHWLANRDKKDNVVIVRNNLSIKEWAIFGCCFACLSAVSYFVLKALNTEQLIFSFLSFISMLPAVYLLARRCKWNQVAFLFNDLFVAILWGVLIVGGDLSLIPMAIYFAFQIVYDAYGVFLWVKLEKQQANNKKYDN